MDPEPQKSMGALSTLSNLSTWCQLQLPSYFQNTKMPQAGQGNTTACFEHPVTQHENDSEGSK